MMAKKLPSFLIRTHESNESINKTYEKLGGVKHSLLITGAIFTVLTPFKSAQAATVVQTIPSSGAISTDTINFNAFDSSLGTLSSVTLDYSLSSDATVSASSCQTFQDCAPGQAELSINGGDAFSAFSTSTTSAEFGWTNDTNTTQTADPELLSLSGSFNFTNTADFIDSLTGGIVWSYDGNTFGFATINSITSNGSFTLTYEFEEAPVGTPEPSAGLGVIALGALGITSTLKRKLGKK